MEKRQIITAALIFVGLSIAVMLGRWLALSLKG